MCQVARDTGLARESLYRSLDAGGNPGFATILKVLSSIGLHLEAKVGVDSGLHVAAKTWSCNAAADPSECDERV
jgi:hypothetical protein